jgi:regulator of protease activity HflC (stomatin/prohibitin superfamily)
MNVAVLISTLASFSWLLVVASVVFAIYTALRGGSVSGVVGLVIGALLLAFGLSTVSQGLIFVQPTDRGVVISAIEPKGFRALPLEPGLRFIVPFFENVVTYPISKQTYTMSAVPTEGAVQGDDAVNARTANGQEVNIDASVIFYIDPSQVVDVHVRWQNRYTNDLVRPLTRGTIRDVVSQFKVEDVYSGARDKLAGLINERLADLMTANGLQLDTFVLRNITFSKEYAASIEQKQIAQQEVERQTFVVDQRKQEANQAREQAQGVADAAVIAAKGKADANLIEALAQAKALREIGEALKSSPDLLQYTYVQNLSDNVKIMLVPANSPYLFPLPEQSLAMPAEPAAPAP